MDAKKLDRFSITAIGDLLIKDFDPKGPWVRYSDVLEMIIEDFQSGGCRCSKCGNSKVSKKHIRAGEHYLVNPGFIPHNPEDLHEEGRSVIASEEHILCTCNCGWKWVEDCKDKYLLS